MTSLCRCRNCRRPLRELMSPALAVGMALQECLEPQPEPGDRDVFSERCDAVRRSPWFTVFEWATPDA